MDSIPSASVSSLPSPAARIRVFHRHDFDPSTLTEVGEAKIREWEAARAVNPGAFASFLGPKGSPRDGTQEWQRFYKKHRGSFFHPRYYLLEAYVELASKGEGDKTKNVLEVGVGNGSNIPALLERGAVGRLFVCDISWAALETIKHSSLYSKRLELFVWNAADPSLSLLPPTEVDGSAVRMKRPLTSPKGEKAFEGRVKATSTENALLGTGCLSEASSDKVIATLNKGVAEAAAEGGVASATYDEDEDSPLTSMNFASISLPPFSEDASRRRFPRGGDKGSNTSSSSGSANSSNSSASSRGDAKSSIEKSVISPAADYYVLPPEIKSGMHATLCIFILSAIAPEHHLQALMNMKSTLAPGGLFAFRDYGIYDCAMLRAEPSNVITPVFHVRGDGTYSYYFRLEEVGSLLAKAGFKVAELEYHTVINVNRKTGEEMKRVFVHAKCYNQ